MVRDRLAASPFANEPACPCNSHRRRQQLTGLPELAARILNRPVRIGRRWHCRFAGVGQGAGLCGCDRGSWSIRRPPTSNTSNRGERGI